MALFSRLLKIDAETPVTLAKADNVMLYHLMHDIIKELRHDLRTVFRLYEAYLAMIPYEWYYEYKMFVAREQ